MGTARDIALIFLSLEAFIFALVPLALFGALAYGAYWVRGYVKEGLMSAFKYAELARLEVKKASFAIAKPFIRVNMFCAKVTAVLTHLNILISGRREL